MAWTYANIAGPTSADSIIFAHESIIAIRDRTLPDSLMQVVKRRHTFLRKHNIIESDISPECGYFVFEKINVPLPEGYSIMDGKYFDLTSYSGYIKINLLSPSIHLLYNAPF